MAVKKLNPIEIKRFSRIIEAIKQQAIQDYINRDRCYTCKFSSHSKTKQLYCKLQMTNPDNRFKSNLHFKIVKFDGICEKFEKDD